MSAPVVIQGTPVGSPHAVSAYASNHHHHHQNQNQNQNQTPSGNSEHEEKKTSGCRDPIFVFLFYGNLAAMIAVAAIYGPSAFDDAATYNYEGYVMAVIIVALISLIFSGLGLLILMRFPETIIKASLIFVVVLSLVWCVVSFLAGSIGSAILGLVFFALGVCYARMAWPRIPFATINLVTGITAIQANFGVTTFAYMFAIIAAGWSVLWSIAFAGLFEYTYDCNDANECTNPNYGYMFLLFVSFFFTHQVLQNSIHVTVAGVVGTWWHSPEDNGYCSSAVIHSFIRTITTSFGSICFGSLLVAILQALRAIANMAQAQGDGGIGVCIAECILGCLQSILEYFNKWAFIYVGLYGFSYLEAGKNVFSLFQNRGWEAVIADDLVGNALFLVSIIVGGLMGAVGLILDASTDLFDDAGGDSRIVAFVLGFIVGLALCSILLSTIASSVNAVIVLFADSPAELQQHYPELSVRMLETWRDIYPGSV